MPPDVLRVSDLTCVALSELIELALRMKKVPTAWVGALPGRALACCFEKPAARAHVSLEAAAHRLGMLPIALRIEEIPLNVGGGAARLMAPYTAALCASAFAQQTLSDLARVSDVPVMNACSDEHDPCQAVA